MARKLLPGATMHYIADDAGFPYGTKTPRQVEGTPPGQGTSPPRKI